MEHISKLIIMCIFLQHCVHTSYALNGQYEHQSYNTNGQSWIPKTSFNPTYYYNTMYLKYQEQQHHQDPYGFQSNQQMSTQYHQFYRILPNQIAEVFLIPSTDNDLYASGFSGQHQMQAQSPYFQEQYQTNRALHQDGRVYDTSQYQYQDRTLQTQEQHMSIDPLESQGQEPIVERITESIAQPVKDALDQLQLNGSPDNRAHQLASNHPQRKGGRLRLQEDHQNSLQYRQPQTGAESYKIEKLPKRITEPAPNIPKIIVPNSSSDINIQTDKSQCPPGFQGLLTKPGDCTKFVRCSDRQINQKDCMATANAIGMHTKIPNGKFEPNFDHKHKVQCNLHQPKQSRHSTGTFCPNGVFGRFPYPFSNEQFINCLNNETFVEPCPTATTFSLSESYCQVPYYKNPISWHCLGNSLQVETHRVVSCPKSCNGSYLYPFDAKKYIICHGGKMREMSCPSGDVYSVSKGLCMVRAEVHLFDSVRSIGEMQPMDVEILHSLYKQYNKIACPLEGSGVFPYPFANTKYIKCIDARLLIERCRPGFLFSLSRTLCDIPNDVPSFDTALPEVIVGNNLDDVDIEVGEGKDGIFLKCPLGVSDNFVYPFLSTRYIKCSTGVTKIETCVIGEIYSIRQKKCLPRNKVDRNDYVEGIEISLQRFSDDQELGVACGPDNIGAYAHPEDLRKFVICQKGTITIGTCDRNTTFDMTQHKCV